MSINRVTISGNLTRDPEVRTTSSGTAVLNFGMAVNDRRKNQQTGEWENQPNFIDCTMFGTRAQSVSQYMRKGGKVAVEGKLHQSSWTAQDGSKRHKVEVWVDEIELMSQGAAQQPQRPQQARPQQPQAAAQPANYAYPQAAPQQPQFAGMPQPVETIYDEDIPFS